MSEGSELLAELMGRAGLNASSLSQIAGVSDTAIRKWLNDETTPMVAKLDDVASALAEVLDPEAAAQLHEAYGYKARAITYREAVRSERTRPPTRTPTQLTREEWEELKAKLDEIARFLDRVYPDDDQ